MTDSVGASTGWSCGYVVVLFAEPVCFAPPQLAILPKGNHYPTKSRVCEKQFILLSAAVRFVHLWWCCGVFATFLLYNAVPQVIQ